MIDWLHSLKIFTTVVETNSFSKTAKILYKSPSAISKQVSSLEHYLKTILFIRSTRKLQLTEAGFSLYQQAEKLLTELDTLKDNFVAPSKKIRGTITIKAPIQFGEYFLTDLFAEFMLLYPEICLKVIFTTDRFFLKDESFDLAIRSEEYAFKDKTHREYLCTTQKGIFATKNYLDKYGTPKTLKDLSQHRCITMAEQQDKFAWILKNKQIFQPDGPLITNNPNMMKAALKANLGLVYVSSYFLQNEISKEEVVELLSHLRPEPTKFYVEYEKAHVPLRIKKLVAFLKTKFS